MPTTAANIAILLLAAGASKRFGASKMLADINGKPLLTVALTELIQLPHKDLLVVLGSDHQQLQSLLSHHNTVVCNNSSLGMGHSIACGVKMLLTSGKPYQGILIALADQVALTAADYSSLLLAFQQDHPIVAAKYNNTIGAPAIFDSRYFDELRTLDGDKGAKLLLKKYNTAVKAIKLEAAAQDIDTQQDLDNYLSS